MFCAFISITSEMLVFDFCYAHTHAAILPIDNGKKNFKKTLINERAMAYVDKSLDFMVCA